MCVISTKLLLSIQIYGRGALSWDAQREEKKKKSVRIFDWQLRNGPEVLVSELPRAPENFPLQWSQCIILEAPAGWTVSIFLAEQPGLRLDTAHWEQIFQHSCQCRSFKVACLILSSPLKKRKKIQNKVKLYWILWKNHSIQNKEESDWQTITI